VPGPVEVERVLEVRGVRSAERARRGRLPALWTDDEPPAAVVFCPECAEREFGDDA
jgi:hypothetical protein